MSVIIILLAISISIALIFLGAFLWSVRTGQLDDDISPASRILFDDKPKNLTGNSSKLPKTKGYAS
ncbi:MAG: cbb3-type cytochrome oxidase assembly protein CcoS [Chitinophagaceae bacterium]|nr:cbb3-type cytochrome oxidase assembly protein CcoS [Chitinophagaceae bacterium]